MLIVTLLSIPMGVACLLVAYLCARRRFRMQALLFAGLGWGFFGFAVLMVLLSYLFYRDFL